MGSSSPSNLVFDEVRQSWVRATPEEQVRQRWLQVMIHQLGYPKELLVVEKEIKELPHLLTSHVPHRRVDILCYGKGLHPDFALYPLLLIECKDESLTDDAIDQVVGYNYHVKAFFAGAVSQNEVRLGYFDAAKKKHVFCSILPPFKELMQWAKP